MDAEDLQEIAARDQLWASLRALMPEIKQLGEGRFGNTERELQLVQVLSRIVYSELQFRANQPGSE